ncbi:MAG TPA: hypothetical protein VGL61_03030 [Kofleriaceae bacterium]|jgi:hypothetical protein
MRRLAILAIALGLAGATTADVLDAPSTSQQQGSADSAPQPGLLDGGILRDGSVPQDGPTAPLDGRATPELLMQWPL